LVRRIPATLIARQMRYWMVPRRGLSTGVDETRGGCYGRPQEEARMAHSLVVSLVFALSCSIVTPAAQAQQGRGGGSPAATVTLDGKQLPPPELPFGGTIERNALQSKSWWPPRVVPPKGAPNILLIMTDDTGFGAGSTFGGVIPMPTLDKLASQG